MWQKCRGLTSETWRSTWIWHAALQFVFQPNERVNNFNHVLTVYPVWTLCSAVHSNNMSRVCLIVWKSDVGLKPWVWHGSSRLHVARDASHNKWLTGVCSSVTSFNSLFNRVWCFSFLTCCLEWLHSLRSFMAVWFRRSVRKIGWCELQSGSYHMSWTWADFHFWTQQTFHVSAVNLNRLLSQHSNSVESCSAKERVRGDRRQDRFQANLKWVIFRIFSFSTDNPTWVST